MAKNVNSQSVQFRQRADIIEAYKSRNISGFAIYCQNQFLFDFDGDNTEQGAEALRKMLDLLFNNKSAAIYTLRVYKDYAIGENGITSETPYHGSFNFRLTDEYSGYGTSGDNELRSRLAAAEQKIKEFEEGTEEQEEEEVDTVGKVIGYITDPRLQPYLNPIIMPLIQRVGGFLKPGNPLPKPQAQIAGVVISPSQKLNAAIQVLSEKVPDLPDVLEKLANMSVNNPGAFNMYINMFRQL